MRPSPSATFLAGFAALSALGALTAAPALSQPRGAHAKPPAAPVQPPAPVQAPPTAAPLPPVRTDLPAYVQKRNAFSIALNTTITAADRNDKRPFSGADVVMMQSCPAGYVGANSPMVRDYPMQIVTAVTFEADGKLLPFVKTPSPNQTNYWTLDKDRGYGLDVIILRFQHTAYTDVRLRAKYEGMSGSSVYGLVKTTGDTLSAAEKTKFLGLNEPGITASKETMDAALAQVGMLRKPGESAVDYATKVTNWTGDKRNLPPLVVGGGENNIPLAIVNHVGGSCNQFSDDQSVMLRSQGVYARTISGASWADRDGLRLGHVVCEFWDDVTAAWYRLPQGTNGRADAGSCFNGRNEDMLIFQVDRTVRYPRTWMRAATDVTGCGGWMVGENGKYLGNKMWESNAQNSRSRPIASAN